MKRSVLALLMLVGCGDGSKGPPAQDLALYRIDAVAAGAECADGGNVVRYGVDHNHNGVLDDDETTETRYLCNPATSKPSELLQRTDPLPASATCPSGGTTVSVGPDSDGNGKLDDGEIVKSTDVCAKTPAAVVVRTQPEPSGADCALGGTAVQSGPDTNGNGKLDDSEVTNTSRVCNPADKAALVRLDPEAKGTHCPEGGTAVKAGLDLDGSGKLEDSEVTSTSYTCNPPLVVTTLFGDHTIATQADLRGFDGVQRLAGSLTITSPDLTNVPLPDLVVLQGSLVIKGNPLLEDVGVAADRVNTVDVENNPKLIHLPLLAAHAQVSGDFTVRNNAALFDVGNQLAERVLGNLTIESNPTLFYFDDVFLKSVGGSVIIRGNNQLIYLAPRILDTVGGDVIIDRNDKLANFMGRQDIGWGPRTLGGSLIISGNAALDSLHGLEGLTRINGDLRVLASPVRSLNGIDNLEHIGGGFIVRGTTNLNNLRLNVVGKAKLTTIDGDFEAARNAALTQIDFFPTSVGGNVLVDANPKLVVFDADLAIWSSKSQVTITNNPLLDTLSLYRMSAAGLLKVANNLALNELALPNLNAVDSFDVQDNPQLAKCAVDKIVATLPTSTAVITTGNDTTATCH